MPIPRTRDELVARIAATYKKLEAELEGVEPDAAELPCTDEWTIRELISVRVRWTEMVIEWVAAGRRGASVRLPAPGFKWNETPRLNREIARAAHDQPWARLRERLAAGVERVLETIAALSDEELLEAGAFGWAGKWPVSRWLSVNTATQYESARKLIRKARKE